MYSAAEEIHQSIDETCASYAALYAMAIGHSPVPAILSSDGENISTWPLSCSLVIGVLQTSHVTVIIAQRFILCERPLLMA